MMFKKSINQKINKSRGQITFLIFCFLVLLISGCQNQKININQNIGNLDKQDQKEEIFINQNGEAKGVADGEESIEKTDDETEELIIPQTLDYPVLFVSQAPFAVWDELHKEACEEAAMIIVAKYFKEEPLTAHIMEQAILDLVKWEKENGYKIDLTAEEAAEILTDYFQLQAELITEVTIERIKQELAAGKLIIIPAAGRQLGNPYFQTPGPIYHMLVIRGYNDKEFITNDVGTKRGEGFKYKYQTLISAIHDWDHQLAEGGMTDEEMEQGQKVMIVVDK